MKPKGRCRATTEFALREFRCERRTGHGCWHKCKFGKGGSIEWSTEGEKRVEGKRAR